MPFHAGPVKVLDNRQVARDYFWMTLRAPAIARVANPGQFVHIRCDPEETFLRRPMSIGRVNRVRGTLHILYKTVGAGTRWLAQVPRGETVDIMGPLGTAFTVRAAAAPVAFLGRGIGIAPLIFWAEEMRILGAEVHGFLSGRDESMKEAFGLHILRRLGVHCHWGSDDGAGFGSDGLMHEFANTCRARGVVLATTCGSRRQARLVARISQELGIRGEVSLEAQMGCAIGACRACACQILDDPENPATSPRRYALVCKDGPVFPVRSVVWHAA